jgi:hypothetical protein
VAGYLVIEIKSPESPKVSQSARAAVSFGAKRAMRISSLNPFDLILGDLALVDKRRFLKAKRVCRQLCD